MYIDTEALAEQREAREKAFVEMLTDEQRVAFNSLRQHREGKETYVNDYDKNANEVIDFMHYLDQAQFARLPAIEAGTVFSIITRMLLSGKESNDRTQELLKTHRYRVKQRRKEREWKIFIAYFALLKSENEVKTKNRLSQNALLKFVGNKIEAK